MTLEDRLERLANRTPPGDPADVLGTARHRAEASRGQRTGNPKVLVAAAAVLAVVALGAGAFALTGDGSDALTVAGPGTDDVESRVTVPESGAAAQQLADGTPVWVVRHDDGTVSVLDAVSTHTPLGAGTLVGWCEPSRGFIDPMYGSGYDEHGRKQAGPAPRGLDSYPISVDGDTATVTGPPVEQPRAEEGGPEPSDPTGPGCLDLTTGPIPGYLPGSFDLHPYETQTPMTPGDAVRQPDGTYVLVDAPIVIVEGEQPLACTSPVEVSQLSCEGVPAPDLFLHDQTAVVVRGPFIARPKDGALTDIAYVGERTITDPAKEGDGDSAVGDVNEPGGVDGPVLYGPEQHGETEQAQMSGRLSFRGDCLYLHGEGAEAEYPLLPVVWPNGTTWQESPEGVRLPDATFVPVGAWVTASGGYDDVNGLAERGHDPAVADRAQTCDVEAAGFVAYVQGEVTVGADGPTVEGDAAVWDVDAGNPPTPSATSVTAMVTRVGCSGGETGAVLEPEVSADDQRVILTFSVEPLPGDAYPCPGNRAVPYVVELDEPVGNRELVDGACLSGEAASTSFCAEGAVRWSPLE